MVRSEAIEFGGEADKALRMCKEGEATKTRKQEDGKSVSPGSLPSSRTCGIPFLGRTAAGVPAVRADLLALFPPASFWESVLTIEDSQGMFVRKLAPLCTFGCEDAALPHSLQFRNGQEASGDYNQSPSFRHSPEFPRVPLKTA